jgi:hypothetical protein
MNFNAEEFLNQSVEGSLDTKIDPLPEDDYRAVIDDVDARQGEKDGRAWTMLIVKWKITDDEKLAAANRDGGMVSQTLMLDLDDSGKLDTSEQKNVRLGKLRDALGQNDGSPWSFGMLQGQSAILRIGHRPDKNDPETIYNDVKAVVPLS